MEIFDIQGSLHDHRSSLRLTLQEFITKLTSATPKLDLVDRNKVLFNSDFCYITSNVVNRLKVGREADDRRSSPENSVFTTICKNWEALRISLLARVKILQNTSPTANVSPLLFWYLVENDKLFDIRYILYPEPLRERSAILLYMQNRSLTTSRVVDHTYITPLLPDECSILDADYNITWNVTDDGIFTDAFTTTHWYDTFNIPHRHIFPTYYDYTLYLYGCLYNTWCDIVKLSSNSAPAKRGQYFPKFGFMDDLVRSLRVLSLTAPPSYNIADFPTSVSAFAAYVNAYYGKLADLQVLPVITESRTDIVCIPDFLLPPIQQFINILGHPFPINNFAIVDVATTLVTDIYSHNILPDLSMGKVIDWPTGLKVDGKYSRVSNPFRYLDSDLKLRVDFSSLFASVPFESAYADADLQYATGGLFLYVERPGQNPIVTTADGDFVTKIENRFLEAYALTQPSRKLISDAQGKAISPRNLADQHWIDDMSFSLFSWRMQLVYFSYIFDSPTPIEYDGTKVTVGPVFGDPSEIYNSSTLKLLTMLVYGLGLICPDPESYIKTLHTSQNILVLGAIDEPLRQKVANLTYNLWSFTGIGIDGKQQNFSADISNVLSSHSSNIIISDMNCVLQGKRTPQAISDWLGDMLADIMSTKPKLLIFKLQWPLYVLYETFLMYFDVNGYRWEIRRTGGSPPCSTECFVLAWVSTDEQAFSKASYVSLFTLLCAPNETEESDNDNVYSGVQLDRYTEDMRFNIYSEVDTITANSKGFIAFKGFGSSSYAAISCAANLSDAVTIRAHCDSGIRETIAMGFITPQRAAFHSRKREFNTLLNKDGSFRDYTGRTADVKHTFRNLAPALVIHDHVLGMFQRKVFELPGLLQYNILSLGSGSLPDLGLTLGRYLGIDMQTHPNIFNNGSRRGVTDVVVKRETIELSLVHNYVTERAPGPTIVTAIDSICMFDRPQADVFTAISNIIREMAVGDVFLFTLYRGLLSTLVDGTTDSRNSWLANNSTIDIQAADLVKFSLGSYEPTLFVDMTNSKAFFDLFTGGLLKHLRPDLLFMADERLSRGTTIPSSFCSALQSIDSVYGIYLFEKT